MAEAESHRRHPDIPDGTVALRWELQLVVDLVRGLSVLSAGMDWWPERERQASSKPLWPRASTQRRMLTTTHEMIPQNTTVARLITIHRAQSPMSISLKGYIKVLLLIMDSSNQFLVMDR